MKVLHLASFAGNIGDVANHEGFYHQFKQLVGREIEVEKLEIRRFYKRWNEMQFDEKFVEFVNEFDLFIIGGGNFFELCWDYSATGTTFDIKPELLELIKIPIFINGIGMDDNKGVNKDNLHKFRHFLKVLFKKNVFFTVRNDGSYDIIKKYFPEYLDKIKVVPDHGFFVNEVDALTNYVPKQKTKYIGINIAMDMSNIRYKNISYEEFIESLAEQLNKLLHYTDYHLFLFPHIQSDYIVINDLLQQIQNEYVRTRVSITPLIQAQELETFKYYKECDIIFAMRFHANVCAISLGIPTLGLISYPKHGSMYDEINLPNRKIEINNEDYLHVLKEEVKNIIEIPHYTNSICEQYHSVKVKLDYQKEKIYNKLGLWLEETNIINREKLR